MITASPSLDGKCEVTAGHLSFLLDARGRLQRPSSRIGIMLRAWLSVRRSGWFRRLTVPRHIPKAEAHVGPRFPRIRIQLAAIVLAVGTDGVNDHTILPRAIA